MPAVTPAYNVVDQARAATMGRLHTRAIDIGVCLKAFAPQPNIGRFSPCAFAQSFAMS